MRNPINKLTLVLLLSTVLSGGVSNGETPVVTEARPALSEDGREILYLSSEQRNHIRTQMRSFLTGVQGLTEAIAYEDREAIAEIAAGLGPHGMQGQGGGMRHGSGEGMRLGEGDGQHGGHAPGEGRGQGMGHGQNRGMGNGGGMGLMRDLPDEFFGFGRPLHQNFKAIADMAETADIKEIQTAFADNLNNCVACHNTFTARDK